MQYFHSYLNGEPFKLTQDRLTGNVPTPSRQGDQEHCVETKQHGEHGHSHGPVEVLLPGVDQGQGQSQEDQGGPVQGGHDAPRSLEECLQAVAGVGADMGLAVVAAGSCVLDGGHAVAGVVEAGAVPVEAAIFLKEVDVLGLGNDHAVLAGRGTVEVAIVLYTGFFFGTFLASTNYHSPKI